MTDSTKPKPGICYDSRSTEENNMKALIGALTVILVYVFGLLALAVAVCICAAAPMAWFVKEAIRPSKPELSA